MKSGKPTGRRWRWGGAAERRPCPPPRPTTQVATVATWVDGRLVVRPAWAPK